MLKPYNHRQEWQQSEYDYLKANYLTKSEEEIGEHLKRTRLSIQGQRVKLKLTIRRPSKNAPKIKALKTRVDKAFNIMLDRMQVLIMLCEHENNNYKKDNYKKELLKLDTLKRYY